jgi:hypothetical protein
VSRVGRAHHVLGIEHLLGELRNSQSTILLRSTRCERCKPSHKKMQPREWNEVNCKKKKKNWLDRSNKRSCTSTACFCTHFRVYSSGHRGPIPRVAEVISQATGCGIGGSHLGGLRPQDLVPRGDYTQCHASAGLNESAKAQLLVTRRLSPSSETAGGNITNLRMYHRSLSTNSDYQQLQKRLVRVRVHYDNALTM